MRVLIIEDDHATATAINAVLRNEGFFSEVAEFGEDGLELCKLYPYDLIVLDLDLPDMDGYSVLTSLRRARIDTPVLILSGLIEVDSKVRSLGVGADDYVTKPFAKDELVARIRALVRRAQGHSQNRIEIGRLTVDTENKTALVDGRILPLTGKEYSVLELLARRKGSTLTKETFLNHLYGGMDEPEMKIIDVFICKLRKKLRHALGDEEYIQTVWGRGYAINDIAPPERLTAEVEVSA
ncbi:MAG: response regulator transcription factor [Pseudomonadota bacterium]